MIKHSENVTFKTLLRSKKVWQDLLGCNAIIKNTWDITVSGNAMTTMQTVYEKYATYSFLKLYCSHPGRDEINALVMNVDDSIQSMVCKSPNFNMCSYQNALHPNRSIQMDSYNMEWPIMLVLSFAVYAIVNYHDLVQKWISFAFSSLLKLSTSFCLLCPISLQNADHRMSNGMSFKHSSPQSREQCSRVGRVNSPISTHKKLLDVRWWQNFLSFETCDTEHIIQNLKESFQ